MKRFLSLLLCMLLLMAVPLPAFADEPEETVAVSFGKCLPGNEYSLFILRPGASEFFPTGNILFMDQLTADSNGEVRLAFIAPSFSEGEVFLGGKFRDNASSPRHIGSFPMTDAEEKPMYMPGMLMEIGEAAFEGGAFTHVYLGESILTIGARAFADCPDLLYIYIPDSVESIAGDAFSGSSSVIIGCREGSVAWQYAVDNNISFRIVE